MATEALKSASVTSADATPAQAVTAGQGAPARLQTINDFVTTTSGVTVGSTYRMARVRSDCKVKHIRVEGDAMTQGPFDIGLYYADGGNSAVPAGTVIDADFFGSAVSFASAVGITDVTNESGNYKGDERNKELWDAVGLSADPGGMFDIVLTSTNTITAGALVALECEFTV